MKIILNKDIDGKILDIGGGGEGIIGRLYKNQVVAIDNSQEELDEAPDCFVKHLMDAEKLDFPDSFFDAVTIFYSFMFMEIKTREKVIMEIHRVLKKGGEIHIWDTDVPNAEKEPFCVDLDIDLPDERISTTYGIMGSDMEQTFFGTKELFENLGLICSKENKTENNFYLKFIK